MAKPDNRSSESGKQKGSSGNGPKLDKMWREAIMLAVKEEDINGRVKLRRLAQQLVKQGLIGDISALREIGDRLDGKPKQETEIGGIGGGKLEVTTEVVFVKPKA